MDQWHGLDVWARAHPVASTALLALGPLAAVLIDRSSRWLGMHPWSLLYAGTLAGLLAMPRPVPRGLGVIGATALCAALLLPGSRAGGFWLEAVTFACISALVVSATAGRLLLIEAKDEQSARRQAALESAIDAIVTADAQGRIINCNAAFEHLYHTTRAAVIGQPFFSVLVPPEERARYDSIFPRLRGYYEPVARRLHVRLRPYSGATPIEADIGLASGRYAQTFIVTATIRDVTEQMHASAELRLAIETRDLFLTNASHDLRTPLTSFYGRVQIVEQGLEARREKIAPAVYTWMENHLTTALVAARKLQTTIETITDAAHLQAGQPLQLAARLIPLCPLVREMCHIAQDAAPRGAPPIQVSDGAEEEGHEPIRVVGDVPRLERVVQNLADNALKYSVGAAEPIVVHVRRDTARQQAIIVMRDRGAGIPPDDMTHIFTSYYRASNAARLAGYRGGTGLGLASSKAIIEQHGGSISIESSLGVGTTVTVRLPLA